MKAIKIALGIILVCICQTTCAQVLRFYLNENSPYPGEVSKHYVQNYDSIKFVPKENWYITSMTVGKSHIDATGTPWCPVEISVGPDCDKLYVTDISVEEYQNMIENFILSSFLSQILDGSVPSTTYAGGQTKVTYNVLLNQGPRMVLAVAWNGDHKSTDYRLVHVDDWMPLGTGTFQEGLWMNNYSCEVEIEYCKSSKKYRVISPFQLATGYNDHMVLTVHRDLFDFDFVVMDNLNIDYHSTYGTVTIKSPYLYYSSSKEYCQYNYVSGWQASGHPQAIYLEPVYTVDAGRFNAPGTRPTILITFPGVSAASNSRGIDLGKKRNDLQLTPVPKVTVGRAKIGQDGKKHIHRQNIKLSSDDEAKEIQLK